MKRVLLEWGAIAASALAMILTAVWLASYFIDPWQYELIPAREFHIIAHDGYISFFRDTAINRQTGQRIIWRIYDPSDPMEILDPVTAHIAWPIPGFQLFYCRLGNGNTVWSLELSLLFPILLLVTAAVGLARRNRRVARSQTGSSNSKTVARRGSPR